jgi:hypothetical protein
MVELIRDALPLERSWLVLAVMDPRSNLCYFNCSGDRQDNNKRAPPMGLDIPFLYLDSVFWVRLFVFLTE